MKGEKFIGERLIINIIDKPSDEEILTNCYYHWSGYTDSALALVSRCIATYEANKSKYDDKKILAIKMLESTGAGLYKNDIEKYLELKLLNPKYPYLKVADDRNAGLIAISQNEIQDNCDSGEEYAYIFLDTETVDFQACYIYDYDDLKELDEDEIKVEDLPEIDFDSINEISFKDFGAFAAEVSGSGYRFKLKDGTVVGKIG